MSTIRFNPTKNNLQIEMKLTGHDVEKAISEAFKKPFTFEKGNEKTSIEILNKYLSSSFRIKMNDQKREYTVIGYEIGMDDELWIYIEAECPKNVISFNLTNKILTEVFRLQQNVMHFEYSKANKQTLVFTKEKHTQKFNWK